MMIIKNEKIIKNMIGSSETICETTFTFEEYEKIMPVHKKKINQEFLEYFVGLVEGSNALVLNVESDQIFFQLQYPKKDKRFLKELRTELGFGHVVDDPINSRNTLYEISNEKGLERIIAILNGNLCNMSQQELFKAFLKTFNKKYGKSIIFKEKNPEINLKTGWLSGFIEAQGIFFAYVQYFPKKELLLKVPKIHLSFELSCEFDTLKQIRGLFVRRDTHIKHHEFETYPTFEISNKIFRKKLIKYLQNYKLKTCKNRPYRAWVSAHSFLEKNKNPNEQSLQTLLNIVRRIR